MLDSSGKQGRSAFGRVYYLKSRLTVRPTRDRSTKRSSRARTSRVFEKYLLPNDICLRESHARSILGMIRSIATGASFRDDMDSSIHRIRELRIREYRLR